MHAKELVGKYVLRTKPAIHPSGTVDNSYMSGTPIKIVEVTDTEIKYEYNSYTEIGKVAQSSIRLNVWGNDWIEANPITKKAVVGTTSTQIVPPRSQSTEFYYEVMRGENPKEFKLIGPLEGIYPVVQVPENNMSKSGYSYVQVINGKVVAALKNTEIVVLTSRI